MAKQRVVLAGGSGFLGTAIAAALTQRDYAVTILSRTARPSSAGVDWLPWDGKSSGPWESAVDGAAAVINLAGHSMNCVHTPENRRAILESRINATRAVGNAIARAAQPPGVWVQASAVGFYGDAGDKVCDESTPSGNDFAAEVCRQWEAAFAELSGPPATRRVVLRVAMVLGRGGGALPPLAWLTRWFLGGAVGSGRQYVSWIHLEDLVAMFLRAIEDPLASGVFNASAPGPVTNAELMRTLRRVLHRPWSPPVPAPIAKIGARWVMKADADLALHGQRCVPRRWIEQGFAFKFPDLEPALIDLLGRFGM